MKGRLTVTVDSLPVELPMVSLAGSRNIAADEVPQEPPVSLRPGDTFTFSIEFAQSGKRLKVEAPSDMLISAFLEEFREELRDVFRPVGCAFLHLYEHNLLLRGPSGKFRPLSSMLTFCEAGLTNEAVCRLRGYIRAEYTNVQLTLPSSREMLRKMGFVRYRGRWMREEDTNFVLLDEMDSISLEEAKERGVISANALERVQRFLRLPIVVVAWFVVLCPESDIEDVEGLGDKI